MEYRFSTDSDRQDILDFINLIFSQIRQPHDFGTLIPKAYAPDARDGGIHALAIRDGRIRGCVGVYPFPLNVAGVALNVGYVGSVSVHPTERGAGVMRQLMDMQYERARDEGLDMLALGGQRQRYEHYGFTPCGGQYRYGVNAANMRKALGGVQTGDIAFEPLAPGEAEAYAFALYSRQPVCGARTAEGFIRAAMSFHGQPFLVRRNGLPAGYLIASGNDLRELAMEEAALNTATVKAWLAFRGVNDITVLAAPHDVALNRALAAFAEGYTLSQNGMYKCLRPERVIRAYLGLKNQVSPLSDGAFTLKIEDEASLRLAVKGGQVAVEETDEAAGPPLTWPEAMQLLFGFNRFYAPAQACAPANWFPLPLSIPVADTF